MPVSNDFTFYELLGIPEDASPEEIRHAYRDAARHVHPDVSASDGATQFLNVQDAFETLSDPERRSRYDETLAEKKARQPILTQIVYSRSKLEPMTNEPQLIYSLIDFIPGQQLGGKPTGGVNFCLVLDRSTSMQGERMDMVKAAAIELVRQLKPEDSLAIVTFSDRAEVLVPATRGSDRKIIEAQIRMIQTGGGTEIFQGLSAGYTEIRRYANRSLINNIILLTDGRTYGDEKQCLALAEQAASQGIRITGLGIGNEWNDIFLEELATSTGGNSTYIARARDIKQILQDKLNDLNQIFAERVTLNLRAMQGVSLHYAFRRQPDPAGLHLDMPMRLGWIPKSYSLSVLLEMIVPPIEVEYGRYPIVEGELNLALASNPGALTRMPILLSRPIGKVHDTEVPPRAIFQALSQITLYRMQDRARQEVTDGKTEDACLRLQRLATQLINFGQTELAQTALMEAERIQQTHMLSETGEKVIKYGTRSLLLPARVGGKVI